MSKITVFILLVLIMLAGPACTNNNTEPDNMITEEIAVADTTDYTDEAEELTEEERKSNLKAHYDSLEFNIVYDPPYFKQALSIGSKSSYHDGKLASTSTLEGKVAILRSERTPKTIHVLDPCSFCEKQAYLTSENPNHQRQRIYHYPALGSEVTAVEGYVCFDTRDFQGSNIPIEGSTSGGIREITIDGTKVDFDVDSDLFFRQSLNIYIGYNKFPVKIVDNSGRERKTWIVIETERAKDTMIENNIDINTH